jgi:hypothetical protein
LQQALAARDEAEAEAERAEAEADRAENARDDAQGVLPDRLRRDVPTLLADTALTYTAGQPGTVADGDIIRTRAEGFSYEVAATGATDQHVTTAGGVKLRVTLTGNESIKATAFGIFPGGSGHGVSVDAALRICAQAGVRLNLDAGEYDFGAGRVTINADNMRLSGVRGKTVIKKSEGSAAIRFLPPSGGIKNIELSDFVLDMTGSDASGFGLGAIEDKTNNEIDGLEIRGLEILTSGISPVFFGDSLAGTIRNVKITDSTFSGTGVGIYGVAFRKQCVGLTFHNNDLTLSHVNSFNTLALYGDTDKFDVFGNRFFGGGHSPISCSPARNGFIHHNYVENFLFTQIAGEGAIEAEWKSGHMGIDTSHDIVISENIIVGNFTWGIFTTRRDENAPNPGSPYNIKVVNNLILSLAGIGINILHGSHIDVHGNLVDVVGTLAMGVNIRDTSHVDVCKNDILLDGSASQRGINNSVTAPNNLKVKDNTIIGSGLYGIHGRLVGDDCTYTGNTVIGSAQQGFYFETAGDRLKIEGNNVLNSGLEGILIQTVGAQASVNGNTVDGAEREGIKTLTAVGVGFSCDNNKVSNITGTPAIVNGVGLANLAKGWSASGNTVHDIKTSCLRIEASCADGGRVSNNSCFDAGGAGISLNSDLTVCIGNSVLNVGSANKINNTGSGNIVEHNITPS